MKIYYLTVNKTNLKTLYFFRSDEELGPTYTTEDYDMLYGCACQRYLFLGVVSPAIIAVSLFGAILWLLIVPCKY